MDFLLTYIDRTNVLYYDKNVTSVNLTSADDTKSGGHVGCRKPESEENDHEESRVESRGHRRAGVVGGFGSRGHVSGGVSADEGGRERAYKAQGSL